MGLADREKSRASHSVVAAMISPEISMSETEKEQTRGRPKANRELKKNVTLAVLPSLYENAQKIAFVDRTNISEIFSEFLESYTSENSEKLKEYDKIKKNK